MSQTEHRPVLIVIAGPNGSGKTTITSKILKHEWLENALYVNPDQVAQDRFGDWYEVEGEELIGRCFCHELDHLDGIVYTQVMDRVLTEEELEELA